jgi:hypothetical protein
METSLPAKDQGPVRTCSRSGAVIGLAGVLVVLGVLVVPNVLAAPGVPATIGLGPAAASATESSPPSGPPASAEAAPAPGSSPADLETYGDADATCREWSNGCQVCRRQPGSDWSCSTPGIACVPESVTCRSR